MKPLPIRTPTQDLTLTGCVPALQHGLFEALRVSGHCVPPDSCQAQDSLMSSEARIQPGHGCMHPLCRKGDKRYLGVHMPLRSSALPRAVGGQRIGLTFLGSSVPAPLLHDFNTLNPCEPLSIAELQ